MPALVLDAPLRMAQQQGKRSFAQTLAMGVGDGFYISPTQFQQLGIVPSSQLQQITGINLILLDKDARQRGEGTLVGLQPNGWTLDGKQRYDVLMKNMVIVPYLDVPLERWGVAVI